MTSSLVPPAGSLFEAVVFSISTLGSPLDVANVKLTTSGNQTVLPLFTTDTHTGAGMTAADQYAFQFDLSGVGGTTTFSIVVPDSASSVSHSSSQLDFTTRTYTQSVVPEPSSLAAALAGLGLALVFRSRLRRQVA